MVTDKTVFFNPDKKTDEELKKERYNKVVEVYKALVEKGYDPVNQLVGFLISDDPTYITNYKEARNIISEIERDELLEDMIRKYLEI